VVGEGQDTLEAPVHSPPLRFQVYERLLRMIVSGRLRPGERLLESELASALGVSRGPIREAFQLLDRDAWIVVQPRRGTFVRELTLNEINDFFDVRVVLERHAVMAAAVRASEERIADLEAKQERAEALLPGGASEELIEANSAVHEALCESGDNQVLSSVIYSLSQRVRTAVYPALLSHRSIAVVAEHRELIAAVRDRDVERTGELMSQHSELTRGAYLDAIGSELDAHRQRLFA
jgi:DNA-binding GntR family transcriptional regulator